VRLPDDEDWLMRPVLADPPLCTYESLVNGTLRLADVAKLNDALSAREENRARAQKAAEAARGKA